MYGLEVEVISIVPSVPSVPKRKLITETLDLFVVELLDIIKLIKIG